MCIIINVDLYFLCYKDIIKKLLYIGGKEDEKKE